MKKYIMGGKNGVYSDIGFQNDIYLGGILYSILIWTYFIFKLFKINLHKEYNNIGILLLFLMIISNIKGIIIENNEIIILIYILYYSSISEKKYELC